MGSEPLLPAVVKPHGVVSVLLDNFESDDEWRGYWVTLASPRILTCTDRIRESTALFPTEAGGPPVHRVGRAWRRRYGHRVMAQIARRVARRRSSAELTPYCQTRYAALRRRRAGGLAEPKH